MTIKWCLRELMDEAKLTYRDLNSKSGVSTEILIRLIKDEDAAASSKTVDKLLLALQPYINRRLTTNDIQEWSSDTNVPTIATSRTARQAQRSNLVPLSVGLTPTEEERRSILLARAAQRHPDVREPQSNEVTRS